MHWKRMNAAKCSGSTDRHLRVQRHSTRGRKTLHELPCEPALQVQFLFEASDPVAVTPDARRQKEKKREIKAEKTVLVKMKFKELSEDLNLRALVFDQYSVLDVEILPKQVDCFFRDARNSCRCRETYLN